MINFDCHAHIYETVTSVPGARYAPNVPATLSDWQSNLSKFGLSGGVIVQVSFLGTNNSELCSALKRLNLDLFAGVAVVNLDVSIEEIDQLISCGIRGFRWNLVRGAPLPDLEDPVVRLFLDRIFSRGIHLEIHLEGPHLANWIEPLIGMDGKIVVDHFGLPSEPDPKADPFLAKLETLSMKSNLYIKLSAPYRTPFDLALHASYLIDTMGPERLLWGSDWPHTQHENIVNYDMVTERRNQLGALDDASVVRDLYGISKQTKS